MSYDPLNGRDNRHASPEFRWGQGDQGPHILRVQLTASLASGGNATAKVIDFTGLNYTVSDRVVTIYDSLENKSGSTGDKFWVIWEVDSRRYEVIGDDSESGVPFRNDSGGTIPAYANMQISGADTVDGTLYVTVIKPDGVYTTAHYAFLVNGGAEVEDDDFGTGYFCQETPRRIKYYPSDGTPAFGEVWGNYTTNEWAARIGGPGYLVLGEADGTTFWGIKDTEVRAYWNPYKIGTATVSSTSAVIVELLSSAGINCEGANASTYKTTIHIAGTYAIHGMLVARANYGAGPKAKLHRIYIMKNGGTIAGGQLLAEGTTYEAGKITLTVCGHVPLVPGDYLQMLYDMDDATDNVTTFTAGMTIQRLY